MGPQALRAVDRLQRSLTREAKLAEAELVSAVGRLAGEHARRLTGPSRSTDSALDGVARALSRLSAAADLGGRLALRFRSKAATPEQFAAIVPEVVPQIAFAEAVRDLEERDPIGAAELRMAGLEVEDAYGGVAGPDGRTFYRHAFAVAAAVDAEVARAVRDRLSRGLAVGESTADVAASLEKSWTWPAAYAATVSRTAFNTATTAGRFREAARVQGSGIPTGFRFRTAGDVDVRSGRPRDNGENHAALDGLVARSDDPIWRRFSPPGGFSCRCALEPVIGDEVPEDFVNVPAGASFAPGFGGRPDIRAYGF